MTSVKINKKRFVEHFSDYITIEDQFQPNLCTHISAKIKSENSLAILYEPRGLSKGSIVCHLGEAHRGRHAEGVIINNLRVDD